MLCTGHLLFSVAVKRTFFLLMLTSSSLYLWFSYKFRSEIPAHLICANQTGMQLPVESILIEPPYEGLELKLLILVLSNPHNKHGVEQRMAVRRTWGHRMTNSCQKCKLVFLLGRSNAGTDDQNINEARKYGDVLISNITDTYSDLAHKVLRGLVWARKLNPSYILKTDDDIYLNVADVIQYLDAHGTDRFYGGIVYRHGSVERNPAHRHYVSRQTYMPEYFPSYCKGAMYIISIQLLDEILKLTKIIRPFGLEDAYVGVLSYCTAATPISIDGFLTSKFLPQYINFLGLHFLHGYFGLGDGLSSQHMDYIDSAIHKNIPIRKAEGRRIAAVQNNLNRTKFS